MVYKVLAVVFLITYVLAVEDIPTSYASFNHYHNTVKHIQSHNTQAQSAPHYYKVPVQTHQSQHSYGLAAYSSTPSVGYNSPLSTQYASSLGSHGIQHNQYASNGIQQHNQYASNGIQQHNQYASNGIQQHTAPRHAYQYAAQVASHSPHYSAPLATQYSQDGYEGHDEKHTHPKYEYSYGVEDHHSGDIHSHKETRDGDNVQGEYSLQEPDGTIRTVKYSVNGHSGFNAVVEKSGHSSHPQNYGKNTNY